ncbi:hypothetical protein J7L48_11165 [bacterium]|nr:hypothetical protein [bacterium]
MKKKIYILLIFSIILFFPISETEILAAQKNMSFRTTDHKKLITRDDQTQRLLLNAEIQQGMNNDTPAIKGHWEMSTTLPMKLHGVAAASLNGVIYIAGGRTEKGNFVNTLYKYDKIQHKWAQLKSMTQRKNTLCLIAYNGMLYAIGGTDGNKVFNTVEIYNPITNTWHQGTPMPTARYNMTAQEVNGKIYVIGGVDLHSHRFDTNEAYDPYSDSWEGKAPMPTALRGMASGKYNNEIYIFGGFSSAGNDNFAFSYNTITDNWEKLNTNFTARHYLTGTTLGDKIYLCGGMDSSVLRTCEIYNIKKNICTPIAPMGNPRIHLALVANDGQIFAIGGVTTTEMSGTTNKVEIYSPLNNSRISVYSGRWDLVKPLPQTLGGTPKGILANNKIYIPGGNNSNKKLDNLYVYDITTNNWLEKARMLHLVTSATITSYKDNIFVFGGYDGKETVDLVQIYNIKNNTWTEGEPMPTARHRGIAEESDGIIYVIAGVDRGGNYYNQNDTYNPKTQSWEERTPFPIYAQGMGSAVYNGKIYVFGGFSSSGKILNDLYIYNPETNMWKEGAPMPTPRKYLSGCNFNGQIYAIGGYNNDKTLNTVEIYDPINNIWNKGTSLLEPVRFEAIAATDLNIYAIGGSNTRIVNIVQKYTSAINEFGEGFGLFKSKLFSLKELNNNIKELKRDYLEKRSEYTNISLNYRQANRKVTLNSQKIVQIKKNIKHTSSSEKKELKKRLKILKRNKKLAIKRAKSLNNEIPMLEKEFKSEKISIRNYLHSLLESINREIIVPVTIENQLPFDEYTTMATIKERLILENEEIAKEKAKNIIVNDYFLGKISDQDIIILEIIHIGGGDFSINYIGRSEIESISFKQEYKIKYKVLKNPF